MNTKYIVKYRFGKKLVCGDHCERITLYITQYMDIGMYHWGGFSSLAEQSCLPVYKTFFLFLTKLAFHFVSDN